MSIPSSVGHSHNYDDPMEGVSFHMVNVQEPVKQMISALSRTMRAQTVDIKDIDRRINSSMVSKNEFDRTNNDNRVLYMGRTEGEDAVKRLDTKADAKEVSSIDSRLNSTIEHIGKLSDMIQQQSLQMRDLSLRMDIISKDFDSFRTPNYDTVFAYVDRKIQQLGSDIDARLNLKSDRKDIETVVPQRLEDLFRNMNANYVDLKTDMNRKATKEDFDLLLRSKADASELKAMATEVNDRVTESDMHQSLSTQLKPILNAVASMEKTIDIQEKVYRGQIDQTQTLIQKIGSLSSQQQRNDPNDVTFTSRLRTIIDDILNERRVGEVTYMSMQSSLSEHSNILLREVTSMVESARLESTQINEEMLENSVRSFKELAGESNRIALESREQTNRVKKGLKDFAENVAKSLSRKVETKEMKESLKELIADQEALKRVVVNNAGLTSQMMTSPTRGRHSLDVQENFSSDADEQSSSRRVTSKIGDLRERQSAVMSPLSLKRSTSAGRAEASNGFRAANNDSARRHQNADSGQSYQSLQNEFQTALNGFDSIQREFRQLQQLVQTLQDNRGTHGVRGLSAVHHQPLTAMDKSIENTDWRLAMGELSINLRRELGDKCGREELHCSIRQEAAILEAKSSQLLKDVATKASQEDFTKLENEVVSLRSKVAGELTGARWLWTSGTLEKDGWVPWDHQVTNAAPAVLQWKKGTTVIKVRMPGLYRLCVAVFTTVPVALQVCLNGEAVVSLQPSTGDNAHGHGKGGMLTAASSANPIVMMDEHKYVLRRMKHTIGEVTCVCIDECLSLPRDGALSVRYHSTTTAQGFMSLRKL